MRWNDVEGTLDQASAAAEKAVALDSESAVAQYRLGWVLSWQQRDEEAETNFDRAVVSRRTCPRCSPIKASIISTRAISNAPCS